MQFFEWLAANPYLLLFALVLAAVLLARARVAGLALDMVASAIVVAAAISALASATGVKLGIDGSTKSIAYWIFMYGLGLRIGPSVALCLRPDCIKFTAVAALTAGLGLAGTIAFARLWDLAPGSAGGLLAGAMTTPAALGAAEEAVRQGLYRVPDSHLFEEVTGMASLAFALTYLWGAVAIFLVCRHLPRALGIDLRAEARRHEEQSGAPGVDDTGLSGFRPIAIRAYRIANEALSGCTVHRFLESHPHLKILNVLRTEPARRDTASTLRADVELLGALAAAGVQSTTRLRDPDTTLGGYGGARGAASESVYLKLGASDDVMLRQGDVLTLGGALEDLAQCGKLIGPEVCDPAALNVPIDQAEIVVTSKALVGRRLAELRGADFAGEVALHHIERGGVPLPMGLHTRLERLDVLFVAGVQGAVDRFAALAGRIVRPSAPAALLTLSAGMLLGLLLGSLGFRVGEARIGLGNAGGLLVSGVIVSWALSRTRWAGEAQGGARSTLEDLALATFVVIVGLDAGAFLLTHGTTELVARFLVAGFFVSTVPPIVAWAVGYHLLGMNAAVLAGSVAGARGHPGPVHDLTGRIGTCVPWAGFPVAYGVCAVLATAFGAAAMALS